MKHRQGIALISVLLFIAIVFMAVIVVAQRASQGAQFQREDEYDLAAFYAAEAGVEAALSRWSEDATKTWGLNVGDEQIDIPLLDGQATYSIRFSSAFSVNNFNQASAADCALGPASLPPEMAYLVVDGQARGRTRRLEVLVARSGLVENPAALLGAAQIELSGNITLNGLRTTRDNTQVSADLVCLNTSNSAELIRQVGPGDIDIDGVISSNSPHSQSISTTLSGANVSGGNLTSQNRSNPDRVDIVGRVQAKAGLGLPAPTLTGTSTQLANQDYYVPAGLSYNGDLVLDGSNLYIEGNLDLNGSISGSGSVFVNGETLVFGDSSVTSGDATGVALYSEGNLTLSGFDGTRLLTDLTSVSGNDVNGVPYSTHLANFLKWTGEMNTLIGPEPTGVTTNFGHGGSLFDERILALTLTADATWAAANMASITNSAGSPMATTPEQAGAQLKLTELVAAQADSPSTRFLTAKFRELNGGDFGVTGGTDIGEYLGPFGRPADGPASWTGNDSLRNALEGRTSHGFFRTLGSVWPQLWDGSYPEADLVARRNELWHMARNTMNQMNLDKPGAAYFQGLIYSKGDIVAQNDLQVIGAIMAAGPTSRIRLNNGVGVTFVPELARGAGSSLGKVGVRTWIRR